jgi:plasmid stabilization system protein ParE
MDFKIVWSDAAIADLQEVCSYVVSEESLSVEILHVWHGRRDEPPFHTP